MEKKFIFFGVKTKTKKQTPTTNVHANKTFIQSIQIPSKIKIKPLLPLADQKTHLSCLLSASSTSTQRSGKRGAKKEKLTETEAGILLFTKEIHLHQKQIKNLPSSH